MAASVINLGKIRLGKIALGKVRLGGINFGGPRQKGPDYNADYNDDFLVAEAEESEEEQ